MTAFDTLPELWEALADTISAGPAGAWSHDWAGWYPADMTLFDNGGSILLTIDAHSFDESEEEELTFTCPKPDNTLAAFMDCLADPKMRRSFVDRCGTTRQSTASFEYRMLQQTGSPPLAMMRRIFEMCFPSIPYSYGGEINARRRSGYIVVDLSDFTYTASGLNPGNDYYYVTGSNTSIIWPVTSWSIEYPPGTGRTAMWDDESATLSMRAVWQAPGANVVDFASEDLAIIDLVAQALLEIGGPAGEARNHRGGLLLQQGSAQLESYPAGLISADQTMRRLAIGLMQAFGSDLVIRTLPKGGLAALRRGVIVSG